MNTLMIPSRDSKVMAVRTMPSGKDCSVTCWWPSSSEGAAARAAWRAAALAAATRARPGVAE